MTEDKRRPLGEWLKQRREELGISLEQAEEATRIRARYLEALEAEDFDVLPDPVVGRGFLRNYASYLELDPQEVSTRFSQSMAPPESDALPVKADSTFDGPFRPVSLHDASSRVARRGWVIALLVVLILAALAVVIWQGWPLISELLPSSQATPRATLVPTFTSQATRPPLSTTTQTPTRAPAETVAVTTTVEPPLTSTLELTLTPTFTPSPRPSPSPPIYTGIFLEVVFTDTSWIQVTVDGVRQFQGELPAGTYRSWYGEERIELRVGNAGAVKITLNGEALGPLGAVGEVVDRVFEKVDEGVILATFTPEVTGTGTVEPTAPPPVEPTTAPPPTLPPLSPTVPVSATATITPTLTITPTVSP